MAAPAEIPAPVASLAPRCGQSQLQPHHRHRDLLDAVDRLTMLVNTWQPMPPHVTAEARRQVRGIDCLLAELACQAGGHPE